MIIGDALNMFYFSKEALLFNLICKLSIKRVLLQTFVIYLSYLEV